MTSKEPDSDRQWSTADGALSKPWQFVWLGLICFHLVAVFAEPFQFFSRSPVQSGADADLLRRATRPYAQFMFLDHGYFFFAPNPGPGHLLRVMADDAPLPGSEEGIRVNPYEGVLFPDRNRDKPRLLYHRYLMHADFVNSRFAPRELNPELAKDPFIQKSWARDRAIYTHLVRAVSDKVKRETQKPFVRVDRLEREIPDRISTLQQQVRISDPRWIQILPESPMPFGGEGASGVLAPNNAPTSSSTDSSTSATEELLVPK
ncbi:MAG: hypothetical protein ACK5PB_11920 [Pirellula sp.]|jgi:hypothetical protein